LSGVGVGIVGTGAIFEQHAGALAALSPRARVVALCDLDRDRLERACERHGIRASCSAHEELVARADVDVVIVCTPPRFHEDVVVAALAAGKHVVCEKPLAHTLASADRIIAAAREHPGHLSAVYQFRHLPVVRRALWLQANGGLGTPLSGRFHRFARFRRPGKAPRAGWWGSWALAGGGVVMTQLIHELDLMCLLFGRPVSAFAVAETLREQIESEDTCGAVISFAGGAICTASASMCAHRSSAGFDVFGTSGSVHSPWSFECLDRERRSALRHAALEAVPDDPPDADPNPHIPYLASILDAVHHGDPLPSGPDDARASLELATAIYASAITEGPVSLPVVASHWAYHGIDRDIYASRRAPTREAAGAR
jgi:UDP-N-acetyl-2-amino-2-deoxyglucuronate dehydrogenase